jgi:hypothetical protein
MPDRSDATDGHAYESVIAAAREQYLRTQTDLPVAEQLARDRRRLHDDALRGRSAFERRLARVVEAQERARIRRERAAAYACGLRHAAVFANLAAAEADRAADVARAARERLVAERSGHEAALADAETAEARTEEERLRGARVDLERHIAAQRAVERRLEADCREADARVAALHDALDDAAIALREAEFAHDRIARASDDAARRRARAAIERRIAELRETEREAARERAEHENVLAALDAGESR